MSYIDGLASGLNTTEIIKGLMQVEAIPQTLLKNQVSTIQQGLDAYASIRTKISGIRTAADALSTSQAWQAVKVTSSKPDVMAVTATKAGATLGSTSLSVTQLAKAMAQSSKDTFASLNDPLGARAIRISANGHTFDSSEAQPPIESVSDLIMAINADSNLNVRASAVQVAPGEFRVVLTAKDTGVANGFSVETEGWDHDFEVTSQAQDALLEMGTIQITRSSNVIDDLIDGVSITLKDVSATPVTIGMERDIDGITSKVKALVEALNGAVAEMKLRTGYDPETNQRSSLTGDATVRSLSQSLVSAVTGLVAGSELGTVGLAGLELNRDGTFSFDEAKFKAAYNNDPAAVEALFSETTSTTGDVSFEYAGWRTQAGTYEINVTGDGEGGYTATIDGEAAEVKVNDDGSLRISMSALHNRLGGLAVNVAAGALPDPNTNDTANVGSVTYNTGAAKRLVAFTNRALDPVDGLLTSAEDARKNRIKNLNTQVEAWELRLEKRETALRRQYTALETLLGQLANQSQWLSGQLAGLNANNQK